MKRENTSCPTEKFKTMIGGQALIEGIMMRGPEKQAIVVRSPKEGLEGRRGGAKYARQNARQRRCDPSAASKSHKAK